MTIRIFLLIFLSLFTVISVKSQTTVRVLTPDEINTAKAKITSAFTDKVSQDGTHLLMDTLPRQSFVLRMPAANIFIVPVSVQFNEKEVRSCVLMTFLGHIESPTFTVLYEDDEQIASCMAVSAMGFDDLNNDGIQDVVVIAALSIGGNAYEKVASVAIWNKAKLKFQIDQLLTAEVRAERASTIEAARRAIFKHKKRTTD